MCFCQFYQFVFIYLLLIEKYCLGLVYFYFNFGASNDTKLIFWIIAKTTFLIFY